MTRTRFMAGAVISMVALAIPSTAMAGAAGPAAQPTPAVAMAETVEADWQLNESPGAPFMVDGSGKGHHGVVASDAVSAGLTFESGLYHWSLRCPACPPAAVGRVVQVPDSNGLDIQDPSVRFTVEFKMRTNKGYGNIMQKGQATTAGGQFKIEAPFGLVRCVFVGANGSYVSVPSPIAVNDGEFHIVKCVHNANSVETWVDGAMVAVKNQKTGPINNAKPFVVGGKTQCNQVTVTCDYYSGYLDWIRITRGEGPPADLPPTAAFTSLCEDDLECAFDGTDSHDPEGGALSYAWEFGDGDTSTAPAPVHAYDEAGIYDVELTVTDPGGHSDSLSREVAVGEPPAATVSFRAAASTNTNALKPSVTVPASVQTGDSLVLLGSTNRNATMSTPAGWTLLGVRHDAPDLKSWAFTRTAQPGAAGTTVSTTLDAMSKTSLTLLAYSGAGPVVTAASAAEAGTSASHSAPAVTVGTNGSWVVNSWVDKTNGHAGWTLPAQVTHRNSSNGAGSGGIVSAVTGDSGPVFAGTWPSVAATSGASSGKAVGWSIVIPPA